MSRVRKPEEVKKWDIHPVWRGIGCIFFILMPILAYAMADVTIDNGLVQPYVEFSPDMYESVRVDFLGTSIRHLKANLVLMVAFTIVLYAFWTFIYAFIYRVSSGGKRYGPLDAKPIKRKKRKTSGSR